MSNLHDEDEATGGVGEEGEKALTWQVHPFRENWLRSSLLIVVLLLVWTYIYLSTEGDLVLTGLSVFLLLGTLAPYFLRSEYLLDHEHVLQKRGSFVLKKRWSDYRNYHVGKRYIQLSPFAYASRLEAFRSLMLYVRAENRAEVLEMVRAHIQKPEKDEPAGGEDNSGEHADCEERT
ncbi:hypothetical protein JXQ70_06025 [bacterium]|nr:hypothetical protein [bacterium]